MANRAIYAIIGAGCFKIINTPELNLYCGNQLQPGGEGSIMYIDDNLRNIITDDAQFLQVAIAAQKGFDNGWTFKEMGFGEDGLPALEMVPPVIIDGIQYDYSKLDKNSINSIKNFWRNFNNVWCSMKDIFSNLSPWAQFQAALMAVGALKTARQVVGAVRNVVSTFSATFNGIFEWWRSTGSDPSNTEGIKQIITTEGKEKVVSEIAAYNISGGDTRAYDAFVAKVKETDPNFFNPERSHKLMTEFKGTGQIYSPVSSPTAQQPLNYHQQEASQQQYQQQQQQQQQQPQWTGINSGHQPTYNRLTGQLSNSGEYDNIVDYSQNLGGKRKGTKRRKQSKKKTKRRKTTRRSRRASSRKR